MTWIVPPWSVGSARSWPPQGVPPESVEVEFDAHHGGAGGVLTHVVRGFLPRPPHYSMVGWL